MNRREGNEQRVAVVGAGITGLSLAHALADRGVECVVYEADEEPGGVIDSRTVDGRVVEVGPQRLRLTDAVDELVGELGLREELVVADETLPLYVYADGSLRLVPRSPSALLRTDLLSARGKLRLLAEPLTGAGDPDASAAAFFTEKFGREAYENLVAPVFGGTYGSDPAAMPARHALDRLLALEENHGSLLVAAAKRLRSEEGVPPAATFEGGLQRLPAALADAHTERVELDTPVTAVREREEGVRVETGRGAERFDRVVLTTPAGAAAEMVADLAPAAAEALGGVTYNPLTLVYLRSDADATGFGYQVRRSEPLRTLGVSWNASMFDRDGVYTAFFGGMHDPGVMELDAAEVGDIAAREFEQVMDADAAVLHVEQWPGAIPAYDDSLDALDGVSLPAGVDLLTNYTARLGIPARVRAANRLAAEVAGGKEAETGTNGA